MRPNARAAAVLVTAFILAGIHVVLASSNREQAKPASAANDACALMTEEDAAAALDEAAAGPKRSPAARRPETVRQSRAASTREPGSTECG